MTEPKKWPGLIAMPLLMLLVVPLRLPVARADATVIENLRIGSNPEHVRIVLESNRPLVPSPSVSLDRNTLHITIAGTLEDPAIHRSEERSKDLVSLKVFRPSGEKTRIDAVLSFAPKDVKTFSLPTPQRFIIDAYRPPSTAAAPEQKAETPPLKASIKANAQLPRSVVAVDKSASGEILPKAVGTSMGAGRSVHTNDAKVDGSGRGGIEQSVLATLIGVTSIIIVLLFVIICFGHGRKTGPRVSWTDHLPPAGEQAIEQIDARILEKMEIISTTGSAMSSDQRISCLVEILRLSLQKNELMDQRLQAVITALKQSDHGKLARWLN